MINELDIEKTLDKIGIDISHSGYWYIEEAVKIMDKDKNISMMEMYEKIAKRFKKTATQVERAIRYQHEKNDIEKYFKLRYKITNKDMIMLILRETKREKTSYIKG